MRFKGENEKGRLSSSTLESLASTTVVPLLSVNCLAPQNKPEDGHITANLFIFFFVRAVWLLIFFFFSRTG